MGLYRILSLDGGGIRGVLTASLLERLEEAQPGFMSKIDLIAGTSTGGILTLGLAAGLTPTEARLLYEKCGQAVFKDTIFDNIRDLGKMLGAEYTNVPLKETLQKQFGEMTLGDLKKKVLVSSFQLDNHPSDPLKVRTWKAKFFHNYPGEGSDAAEKVVDVALRTSAAPTYFPVYGGYVDGGVVANNPSMCAMAQAINTDTGGQNLADLRLLSMGTGINPRYINVEDADWGLAKWAPHLISLILEGSVGLSDYQCLQVLGDHYLRINPLLPTPIGLDRTDQVPLLKEIACNQDLSTAIDWLNINFRDVKPQTRKSTSRRARKHADTETIPAPTT